MTAPGESNGVAELLARSGLPDRLQTRIRRSIEGSGLAAERALDVAMELIGHCQDALEAGRTAQEVECTFGDPTTTRALLGGSAGSVAGALPAPLRSARVVISLSGWVGDLRLAVRTLLRRPAFAALAVLTLAVGIGIHSAVFSVAYGVLLRPLPYPGSDRLVNVWQTNPEWLESPIRLLRHFATHFPASYPTVRDWDSLNTAFSAVGGYREERQVLLGNDNPVVVPVSLVTSGVFEALAVPALRGRVILPEEDEPGAPQVAVVSEAFWRSALGADPAVLGRQIVLNHETLTIVGVMPRGFGFPASDEQASEGDIAVWRTYSEEQRLAPRSSQGIRVVARLRPGVGVDRAGEAMTALSGELESEDLAGAFGARVVERLEEVAGHTRPVIALLMAAAAVVLLIACFNLANLLLIRGAERRHDFAIRSALGAHPKRLVRQLVAEGIVLGVGGAIVGVAMAALLLRPLVAALPADMPRLDAVAIDPAILGVSGVIAVTTALLSTVLPVLKVSRGNLGSAIQHGVRGTAGRERSRARALLVVAQVAGAFLLVAGAGVLLRSFEALSERDPGFRSDRVVSFQVEPPESRYPDEAVTGFHERLTETLAAIPGVRLVGSAENLPYAGATVTDAEIPTADSVLSTNLEMNVVGGHYFDALSIALRSGRFFERTDREGGTPVVVVNEEFRRQFWPEGDVLGRTIRMRDSDWHVVGVVADVQKGSPAEPVAPMVYLPLAQSNGFAREQRYVVQAAGAAPLFPAIRDGVARVDAAVPVDRAMALDDMTAEVLAQPRFRARLVGLCAGLAALLAVIGIYGVMMYSVLQSRRAIGIQMALGADRRRIVSAVVRRSVVLGALGLGAGLAIAAATFRGLEGFVYGVAPVDPVAVGLAGAVILALATLAAFVPAYRASRVDPMTVLRQE